MKTEIDEMSKLPSEDLSERPLTNRLPHRAPEARVRRILVPVDFSESSREALRYALLFARKFNAAVLLLHVVEDMAPPPDVLIASNAPLVFNMHEEATKELFEWQRETGSRSVSVAVRTGSPRREIVQAASEGSMDLIIIGTHGRTGLAHLLLGGTAEQIVRHAPCPVMVVRAIGQGASAGHRMN